MMHMLHLWQMTAADVVGLLRSGKVSVRE